MIIPIVSDNPLFEVILWILTIAISTAIIIIGLVVERRRNKDGK